LITYYLKDKLDEKAISSFRSSIAMESSCRTSSALAREGVESIAWNLRLGGPEVRRPPTEEQLAFGGGSRGPQVLPGTYTVKLTVNDKVLEERVEVKLDPAISVPVAALQETLDMQVKLRDMQSTINLSLRFLDSLKEQLKQAQTTMKTLQKEPDKDLMKALEDYIKELDTLQDRLAARNEGLGFAGARRWRTTSATCSSRSIRTLDQRSGSGSILVRFSRCIARELKR
jgi:hypothetical protein